jgi:hypothetical protein
MAGYQAAQDEAAEDFALTRRSPGAPGAISATLRGVLDLRSRSLSRVHVALRLLVSGPPMGPRGRTCYNKAEGRAPG